MINRRNFCLALGGSILSQKRAIAGQRKDAFSARVYDDSRGRVLPYRLFIPESYDNQRRYPLVLWLHGGAGRGSDNLRQISGGNRIGSHVWTLRGNQSKRPCFVVAPQCPASDLWATLETASPTEQMGLVLALLKHLQMTFNIDTQRLYVAGQSMGGFGTWSVISQYPDMFAAAVPVCGGGNESKAPRLVKMPIWAFHGEKDQAVSVDRSRKMVDAIKGAGGRPRYTEYHGEGHVIWDRVFSESELLPWVFSQSRSAEK
jgi:predicted peptidase